MGSPSAGWWHGTGRYKYENGEVVDILKEIVATDALAPQLDGWDRKNPDAKSVSLARSRAYARLYASLFLPANQRSWKELWMRLVWSWRYLLPSLMLALSEYAADPFTEYKQKSRLWTSKLSRKPRSLFYFFLWGGTDIQENYPIVIGIRAGTVRPMNGSRFISLHEDRSEDAIPLESFSHIEVPEQHVAATRELLEGARQAIPVLRLR